MNPELRKYFKLMGDQPELFRASAALPICTDEHVLLEFQEKTDRTLGVITENHGYWMLLADLIQPQSASPFVYMRVVPYSGGGSVILPVWKYPSSTPKFGLLNNFRHSIRNFVFELPRGHQQEGLSPEANAKKELCEELNISNDRIERVLDLGTVMPDSGLTASEVSLFAAEIVSEKSPAGNIGHEGIKELLWVDREALEKMIADGRITDSFTIAAYTRYMLKQQKT